MARPFWLALEDIAGLTALQVEWKTLLGGQDFTAIASLLRPSGRIAHSFPCPNTETHGCAREVVQHSSDDWVAVCRGKWQTCDAVSVARSELSLYELILPELAKAIATSLDLMIPDRIVAAIGQPILMGFHGSRAIDRTAVYLCIDNGSRTLAHQLRDLAFQTKKSFVVFSPTARHFDEDCVKTLGRRSAHFIPLDPCLEPVGAGQFRRTLSVAEIFQALCTDVPFTQKNESTFLFRKESNGWHLRFDGQAAFVKHLKGMRYIRFLLSNPRKSYSAIDLAAHVEGSPNPINQFPLAEMSVAELEQAQLRISDGGYREDRLDRKYVRDLEGLIEMLEDDLLQANITNDDAKAEDVERQLTQIKKLKNGEVGWQGQPRRKGAVTDSERVRVYSLISTAKGHIAKALPVLGDHLRYLKTGDTLSYDPPKNQTPAWEF